MATTNEILASVSSQVRASEARTQEKINALQKELERRRATEEMISEAILVLVRDNDAQIWNLQAFERYKEGGVCPYICKSGLAWMQCIPYNRDTEKLLNTSNPYICDDIKNA